MTNRNIKREGQRPRCPQPQPANPNHITLGRGSVPAARNPQPETAQTPKRTVFFSLPPYPITHYSSLITHIPKYRNQISTLLAASPLKFTLG